ncbi:MAG: ABC transporter permease subunit [Clostridia bacterium]|nr:ABC transporter permease subunit [Clostridia bacterium]
MSKQNELNNEALEAQVEATETAAEAEEAVTRDNKDIAATLAKQNPKRAQEIAKERLAQMTPEQIAALRAAKAAKAEAAKAAQLAADEEAERLRQEEIQKKQLSDEQKARIVEQLSQLTPEQLEAVKKNRAAKQERDRRLAEIEARKEAKKAGVKAPVAAAPKAKKKRKRSISYESKQAFTGFMFVLPWFIGFLLFFAVPCFQSLRFSFSKVSVFEGYACTWAGIDNYKELLAGSASFLQALTKTLTDLAVNVPVILIFSLFVAVLLNRKFVGRGLVRGIFFLPVIVTTGVVMTTFNSTSDASAVLEGEVSNGVLFEVADATEFLTSLGLNAKLTEYMTLVADRIFNVVWDSGIQILLFLAALQGISPSLYEASDVEGATAWETFWLITFPNVTPIILVNIVYTIVDTFGDTDNAVMKEINKMINSTFNFGGAAAASWTFFLVVLIIIAVIFGIFQLLGERKGGIK